MAKDKKKEDDKKRLLYPFQRAVFRGLAVALPPLLTLAILAWVFNSVQKNVILPLEGLVKWSVGSMIDHSLDEIPEGVTPKEDGSFRHEGRNYVPIDEGDAWVPSGIFNEVDENPGKEPLKTGRDYYDRYIQTKLRSGVGVTLLLALSILLLYLLGKFLAAGVGRFVWNSVEQLITSVPLVRSIYTSVKQVTDFVFTEREIEFNRCVAVEYPRKGIWSVGFVTGESMLDIRAVANEPVMSVLMPTSPMPATGFTVTVRKSETVDLNITVDQAFQFCFSCGVVVPITQQGKESREEIKSIIEGRVNGEPTKLLEEEQSPPDRLSSPATEDSSDS